jgi:poly-gamma-glutamate synthesis protein (capsule biosynthesis protein)
MQTKLLLAGDVMTGRGIDQVMPHPCGPQLDEPSVHHARDCVRRAERTNGPIPSAVTPDYIWGDALAEIDRFAPHATVINLETAITSGGRPWPHKEIHHRMHPDHIACLGAARVDICTLANNHVLDYGEDGFSDTLSTLRQAGVATAGAGRNHIEAGAPAILALAGGRRLLVFAFATYDCGAPPAWEANHSPGINMLPPDDVALARAVEHIRAHRRPGDLTVVSIHWGPNWVGPVPASHRRIAHRLIGAGAADVVHGHSSHHPLPAEVHQGKLILYGCGDLINDYEGILQTSPGRSDLVCLYAVTLEKDGRLRDLEVLPFRLERFRLRRLAGKDRARLADFINRRSQPLGTRLTKGPQRHWHLTWPEAAKTTAADFPSCPAAAGQHPQTAPAISLDSASPS